MFNILEEDDKKRWHLHLLKTDNLIELTAKTLSHFPFFNVLNVLNIIKHGIIRVSSLILSCVRLSALQDPTNQSKSDSPDK